jgi:SNF2 family DNA or RNA helicase
MRRLASSFEKIAKKAPDPDKNKGEEKIELKPHQKRVLQKLLETPGLLVYHGLGSGKTITSISAADKLGLPAEAVVPASLRPNYLKEIAKVKPKVPFDLKSYEGFTKSPSSRDKVLIFDEAHRLQDPTSMRTRAALEQASPSARRILLTGTPIQNYPSELAPLLNIAAGKKVLPTGGEFEKEFVEEKEVSPGFIEKYLFGVQPGVEPAIKNKAQFARAVRKYVDYHPSIKDGFPSSSEKTVKVQMSPVQKQVYDYVARGIPSGLLRKVERNLPPSKKESANLAAFLSAPRAVSNTPHSYQTYMTEEDALHHSPKFQKILSDFGSGLEKNPRFKGVIYSNFIRDGIQPLHSALTKAGVPAAMFTGELSDRQKKKIVEDYNADKIKALLVSGAGSEGLDLKGTRMVQVVEPHWNKSRIKQVIGRAIRYKSHEHLPPDERHVDVRHYHSTTPPTLFQRVMGDKPHTSTDEYMHGLAGKKQKLIDQFLEVLQQEGGK